MTFKHWLFASAFAALALANTVHAQTPKSVQPHRGGPILYLTPEAQKDCPPQATHDGIIPAEYSRAVAPVVFYPCPTAKPPLIAEPYRPGVTPGELLPLAPETSAPR